VTDILRTGPVIVMSYHGTSDGFSEASMHYGGDRSGGNAGDRNIHGYLPSAKNLEVKKSRNQ
jgi:hypothetical protein